MLAKLGGRKFLMAMLILVVGIVIDFNTERGLGHNLMYLMLGIIGSFSVGNALSKAAANSNTIDSQTVERVEMAEKNLSALHSIVQDTNTALEESNKRMLKLAEHLVD